MLTFELDEGDEEKQEGLWRFRPSYIILLTLYTMLRVEHTIAGIHWVSNLACRASTKALCPALRVERRNTNGTYRTYIVRDTSCEHKTQEE